MRLGRKKKKDQLIDQVVKLMGCYGSETRHGFLLEAASDRAEGKAVQAGSLRKTKVDPAETKSNQQMQGLEITY